MLHLQGFRTRTFALVGACAAGLAHSGSQRQALACACHRPEEGTDPSFTCERVCTSDRLLRRMGGLSKDPTPHTCVTVCGVGGMPPCYATWLCSTPYS